MSYGTKILGRLSLLIGLVLGGAVNGAGWSEFTFYHGGFQRSFRVYVPSGRVIRNMNVVLALHGGGGKSISIDEMSGLSRAAQRRGFIVVYPQGVGNSWNAGKCCGEAVQRNVDDIGFLKVVLARVATYLGRAPRVFVTGHSNGGMMAYRMACEMADQIEAIVPIGASKQIDSCRPSRPVPTLHLHGTSDPCQPFAGGNSGACLSAFFERALRIDMNEVATPVKPLVNFLVEEWIPTMGARGKWSMPFQSGASYCYETKGLAARSVVQYCAIDGMGHVWPGGFYGGPCHDDSSSRACYDWKKTFRGPRDGAALVEYSQPNRDLEATRHLIEFFQRFGLN